MSPSLLELSAHCHGRGGSSGGDAGSAGSGEGASAAADEVFLCFLEVDCFLGDLLLAVVPRAGAWKVAFSWVCDAFFFTICILFEGRVGVW